MKEMKNKIEKDFKNKKIIILVIFILFILGLLFGSLYITIMDNSNKKIIIETVNNHFKSYNNISFSSKLLIFKNTLTSNLLYFAVMWLLGLSIIGLPLIGLMIFFKSFITGFSVASIFACYKFKGFIGILIYLFPSNLIFLFLSMFLGVYSLNLTIKLGNNALCKKTLNFGLFMGKYFFVLLICILICVACSLFEAFISPLFYNLFTK